MFNCDADTYYTVCSWIGIQERTLKMHGQCCEVCKIMIEMLREHELLKCSRARECFVYWGGSRLMCSFRIKARLNVLKLVPSKVNCHQKSGVYSTRKKIIQENVKFERRNVEYGFYKMFIAGRMLGLRIARNKDDQHLKLEKMDLTIFWDTTNKWCDLGYNV